MLFEWHIKFGFQIFLKTSRNKNDKKNQVMSRVEFQVTRVQRLVPQKGLRQTIALQMGRVPQHQIKKKL